MKHFFFLLTALILIVLFGYIKLTSYCCYLEKVTFQYENKNLKSRILIVNSRDNSTGQTELEAITFYQNLTQNNFHPIFLVVKNSGLEQKLKDLRINYYAYKQLKIIGYAFQLGLKATIKTICKENKIEKIYDLKLRQYLAQEKI